MTEEETTESLLAWGKKLEHERDVLKAELALHEEFIPTHEHLGGALYMKLFDTKSGGPKGLPSWSPGVAYRDADGNVYWCTQMDWERAFKPWGQH